MARDETARETNSEQALFELESHRRLASAAVAAVANDPTGREGEHGSE